MPLLKPRNGWLWCQECGRNPDKKEKAQAGDPCGWCKVSWNEDADAGPCPTYQIDKTTILGPQQAVTITGNPFADAAKILVVDGWVAGNFVCEEGKKCLAGAIYAACGLSPDPSSPKKLVAPYIKTKWYQAAERRARRAIVTLALAIDRDGTADTHSDFYSLASNPAATFEQALSVVTEFNDTYSYDRREVVIKKLKDTAKEYSPHKKLPENLLSDKKRRRR